MSADKWVVHTAGPVIGAVQRCSACGHVLADNSAWFEGRAAVLGGDDRGPSWWPQGGHVAQYDVCTTVLPDRPLESDERLCAGAN